MAGADWQELTARESAVLGAVERRLSNAEIADEFYISVRTVESHIASLRRKLGVDSRAKLMSAARARRGTTVQLPQNTFVGRDADIAALKDLLGHQRWVTVVGPAGAGKTRLTLELAASSCERVPVVAELEHASSADVEGVIAKAVGLGTDSAGGLVAACALALEAQPYLLVLDNVDRVTDAVAATVSELLTLTRSVVVLATSRSPIGGSDETIYPLDTLATGRNDAAAAVQLFFDRARSAAPLSTLSDDDVELVSAICRRLDGLPLAIELAAARVRHLPLTELAARLEDGFGPLDRAGSSSRHRTLETAFDWTWDLLDGQEREVLSRLAALPRTFDIELAEAVAGPDAGPALLRLLDRSLVSATSRQTEPRRFRMLASLRAFVLDRTPTDVAEQVRLTHADFYASRAEAFRAIARNDDSRSAAERAKGFCPELNAAFDWSLKQQQYPVALSIARTLSVGGEQYGADLNSLDTISRAARDPHVREIVTTGDLLDLGIALCYGNLDLVEELAAYALDLMSDKESELAARHLAGIADAYLHRGKSSLSHLDAAEELADELGETWQLASIRQARGIALRGRELSDLKAAMSEFESAMHTYAQARDPMHVNNARYMMASTAAEAGVDTERALRWVEECAAYSRASGNRHEFAHAILTRAALINSDEVEGDLYEAVDRFRAVGDLRCLTRCYLLLAQLRTGPERAGLIRQALDVARRARDVENQSTALEQLIETHWESGSAREAALALGELTGVIGYEPAIARCPAELVADVDRWDTAIAEGRARAAG